MKLFVCLASLIVAIGLYGTCGQAWYFADSNPVPLKAVAKFDGLNGAIGYIKFTQNSESEPTIAEYDLKNLRDNNRYFHVHVKPVPTSYDLESIKTNATAIEAMCKETGGHFNPFNITVMLPPKSAPFDSYELGDLSGKHGAMTLASDKQSGHYAGSFTDNKLPLFGQNTIIGRSIVIHKTENKDRWICASIVEEKPKSSQY